MKAALVIQGPIISYGLNGGTVGNGKTRVSKNRFVEFNCTETITRNVQNGLAAFSQVVLSTWKNQDLDWVRDKFPELIIVESDDPGAVIANFRKPIPGMPQVNEINTIRQFTSTLEGIKSIDSNNNTHVVKIRTDQELHVGKLLEAMRNVEETGRKLLAPFLKADIPFAIPDFYLGGRVNDMLNLCSMMSSRTLIIHANVHRDLAMKSLILFSDILSQVSFHKMFIKDDLPSKEIIPYLKLLPDIWLPGSKELYERVVWRGVKLKEAPKTAVFSSTESTAAQYISVAKARYDYHLLLRTAFGIEKLSSLIPVIILSKYTNLVSKIRRTLSYLRNRKNLW